MYRPNYQQCTGSVSYRIIKHLLNERYQWSTSCNKKKCDFALTYLAFLQFNNDRIYSSPVRLNYRVIALWFCKQNYLKYSTVISLEPVHVSCNMFIPKCHWHRRLALKADIFFFIKGRFLSFDWTVTSPASFHPRKKRAKIN